jgi:hypothetical protein
MEPGHISVEIELYARGWGGGVLVAARLIIDGFSRYHLMVGR